MAKPIPCAFAAVNVTVPVTRFSPVTTTFSWFALPASMVSTWPTSICAKSCSDAPVTVTEPGTVAARLPAVVWSAGAPAFFANTLSIALAAPLSAAPNALVESCFTPLSAEAPRKSRRGSEHAKRRWRRSSAGTAASRCTHVQVDARSAAKPSNERHFTRLHITKPRSARRFTRTSLRFVSLPVVVSSR